MQHPLFLESLCQLLMYLLATFVAGAWIQSGMEAGLWFVQDLHERYKPLWKPIQREPGHGSYLDGNLLPRFGGLRLTLIALLAMAGRDTLTGLLNRAAIMYHLNMELSFIPTDRTFLAVVLVDIDDLKKLNDAYGNKAGDEALRIFANAVQGAIQPYDYVGRYGDDEFLVLISEFEAVSLEERLDLLHRCVAPLQISVGQHSVDLRCSLGTVLIAPTSERIDLEFALTGAEQQLRQAKCGGRNRSCYRWHLSEL